MDNSGPKHPLPSDSNEVFRSIANCTFDWESWLSTTGQPLWINSAVERLTGYTVAECFAMEGYPLPIIHPADRERMRALFEEAQKGSSGNHVEFKILHRDGRTLWGAVSWIPFIDEGGASRGYRTSVRDLTSHKQHQETLLSALQRLNAHIDTSPLAVVEIDFNTRILRWSHRAEELFGWREREVLGRTLADVQLAGQPQSGADGPRGHPYRTENVTKDGRTLVCEWYDSAIYDTTGRVVSTLRLGLDVTERHRAEQELARLNANLEDRVAERTSQLESEMERRISAERTLARAQRMETLGRLAGGLAHDFNNTLAAVKAFIELAQLKTSNPQADNYLSRALDAVDIGANVNRRLLTFARREPATSIVATQDAITGISSVLEKALGPDISVQSEIAEGLWLARIDRSELESAILNLAINARDAMPDGGTLLVKAENVAVSDETPATGGSMAPGEYIHIIVQDTGKGMSPAVLEKLDAPFFTTKGDRGTGLGLHSVREFMRTSHGCMILESAENAGTRVHLYLPRAAADLQIQQPSSSLEAPLGDGELILLVEDDNTVLEAVSALLEGLAYSVVCARSGTEALEILASGQLARVILSDIVLPGKISGYDLARVAAERRPSIAVILSSGKEDLHPPPDVKHAAVLRKPYTRQCLANALAVAIRTKDHATRETSHMNT